MLACIYYVINLQTPIPPMVIVDCTSLQHTPTYRPPLRSPYTHKEMDARTLGPH